MDNTRDYKIANAYTLKCMRVTLIIMVISYILNLLKIFIIDQNIMNTSLIGLIIFFALGYLVKLTLGFERALSSYLMLFLLTGMLTFANMELAYHGTLFMLLPLICSILYGQNKYVTFTGVLTALGFLISVVGGFFYGLCDANMLILTTSTSANEITKLLTDSFEINKSIVNLVLFYVVPRCFSLFGIAAVLNYIKKNLQEKTLHEQESIQLAENEKMANQAKSRFLAQMSHEIRTPINAVLGMNEMILHRSKDREILEYSGNIKKAGKNLLMLINTILDFSKIEDGKMELVPAKYNTADLIESLRISVEQRAKDKGLSFMIDADKNLPSVLYGDDMRISQIIINLLTNAVKYTKSGTVSLSINEQSIEDDMITLYVEVADTGIGIKEEDQPKLFTSFERLDMNKNRTIEGTGLGLAITTKLLDMMGSKLEVNSTYGKGSVFYFSLTQKIIDRTPISELPEKTTEEIIDAGTDHLNILAPDARVLVVDDNEMNLKVIRNLLDLFKIDPDMESSGKGAISRMRDNEYDIVFMDHMMPEMDGIETLKKLREENLVPSHTVVIVLTANAIVGAREEYIAASFNDYLTKPIEMDKLAAALNKYLPADKISLDEEIMEFSPEDESEESDADDGALMEGLEKIGLDTEEGLRFCANDISFYREILNDFIDTHSEKEKTLNELLEKKDWDNYGIQIHAFKSNLRSIGAAKLSEKARLLEEASNKGYDSFINENHSILLEDYDRLVKNLKEIEGLK